MTVSCRKKVRSRKSVFNLWIPTKAATYNKCGPFASDSPISDASPTSEPIITTDPGKDRLKIRLTRSGSKLLLLLGLGSSANSNKTSVESVSCEDPQSAEPRSPPLNTTEHNHIHTTSDNSPECESPTTNFEPEARRPLPSTGLQSPAELEESVQHNGEGDDGGFITATGHQRTPSARFVNRLSRRLSMTFGKPTVIRRTHFRSRPVIPFLESPISPEPKIKQEDGANDSSGPSTAPSSNSSPLGHSTPLTPATSAEPSPSKEKYKDSVTNLQSLPDCAPDVAVSQTTKGSKFPIIAPSIVTVEAATVAKVFLELYFNSIFQNSDPRSQRQQELEQRMYSIQLAPDEQFAARCNWLLQENEHLRQCRTLKAMRSIGGDNSISVAGYEAIKVLGKGSFGVVRLVREKGSKKPTREEDFSIGEEVPIARGHPLDMLKSAVDGKKNNRRRSMIGENKDVYAMKVIKKSDMIRNSQEGHIRAERDFLVASEKSRWVVPLIASFQDGNHLYLVMDYMVGGDFLGLLIRKDILREDWTKFYIAEMILCIEEAHRLCWIHRDVKPDNFLVSASGHLKISDFGLAFNGHWSHDQSYYYSHRYSLLEKLGITVTGDAEDQKDTAEARKNPSKAACDPQSLIDYYNYHAPTTNLLAWRNSKERRRFAKSVVGTSQYMAPEVIRGEMYDGRCDWWSLGIILYECLYGFTPFACENRHDTKLKILHHARSLQFPREKQTDKLVSQEAVNLISRILQERHYRLCSQEYQANDVLSGRPVTAQFLYSMDPRYKAITSYFVYPNDAADIKAHPFFRGIRWNELHMTQPPLIPRVRNWEDTRYFDDWKGIAKIDEASPKSDSEGDDTDREEKLDSAAPEHPQSQPGPALEPPTTGTAPAMAAEASAKKAQEAERRRERKRPRDKILRDKKIGKAALEIRKKGAFLGYTYRRPRGPAMALQTERGCQPFSRGDLAEFYAL
ncbi:uncharacterized protein N7484_005779 [Penicillium longicatenatum]|uniref:uncharacterized protein n=1 Tax=Penicillium longicatenatum TaxID=1561947 RepID=UPI00254687D8|nr:uncharacterized protein N7484_005779 [Penicillium longicatenatum]KAJ5643272.1 hypothetical protein N7484_005779 [Penicillium longicatenatum]